ncbi:uncharacterized protein LOC133292854 [Gastrolobium bilobum]|uniref:uncharacterized protein LOC133292854 n=1 Tax=Gastrolobium bilobum TaxID=150636 RepID=UPI002AB29508|nr:uncharacterized protein LOC133292854 [Gastrolobium bilobum]
MTQRSAIHSYVSDHMETVVHVSSDEARDTFFFGQIYQEAVRALAAFDEFGRLTDPGDPGSSPTVVQTVEPPCPESRSQRARHEELPLHFQTPPVEDRPVILQTLHPRPVGMFYAPGYPSGPSQQYWWPPQYVQGTSSSD